MAGRKFDKKNGRIRGINNRHFEEDLPVRKQIVLLTEIQKLDQELEGLRHKILEGPIRIKDKKREIQTLRQSLEEHKDRIREAKRLQRHYESEIEDDIERIKKSKARLVTIKNNKEYQAVLKEIEETDKAIQEKEDNVLRYLEEMETLQGALSENEEQLSAIEKRIAREIRTIEDEVASANKRLSETDRQRQEIASGVDKAILAKYERLKHTRGGVAVVCVDNATCSGCHMNIPPQMYNELQQQDSLKFCPNCERIIYWKNGDDAI